MRLLRIVNAVLALCVLLSLAASSFAFRLVSRRSAVSKGALFSADKMFDDAHVQNLQSRLMQAVQDAQSGKVGKSSGLCVGCTIILGLTNQNSLATGVSPADVWKNFCDAATNPIGKLVCGIVKDILDLIGLAKIDPKQSPEVTCQSLKLCPTPLECTLFPTWPPTSSDPNPSLEETRSYQPPSVNSFLEARDDYNFWQDFLNALQIVLTGSFKDNVKQLFDEHLPMNADDQDGDRHATTSVLRGSSWRGRDCNDKAADVYPGRSVSDYPASVDHNCNGIYELILLACPARTSSAKEPVLWVW